VTYPPYQFQPLAPSLVVEFPSPPSVNKMYGTNWQTRRRFLSKDGEQWFKAAATEAKRQLPPTAPCVPGPVAVTYEFGRILDNRVRDLMNLEKATSDLLVKLSVIGGDHLIQQATLRWVNDLPERRARVTIQPFVVTP